MRAVATVTRISIPPGSIAVPSPKCVGLEFPCVQRPGDGAGGSPPRPISSWSPAPPPNGAGVRLVDRGERGSWVHGSGRGSPRRAASKPRRRAPWQPKDLDDLPDRITAGGGELAALDAWLGDPALYTPRAADGDRERKAEPEEERVGGEVASRRALNAESSLRRIETQPWRMTFQEAMQALLGVGADHDCVLRSEVPCADQPGNVMLPTRWRWHSTR
jgi:hypothetical protein